MHLFWLMAFPIGPTGFIESRYMWPAKFRTIWLNDYKKVETCSFTPVYLFYSFYYDGRA
jgi:hypothetical protein